MKHGFFSKLQVFFNSRKIFKNWYIYPKVYYKLINDKFVILAQAIINPDNSFEETIKITDKFSEHGIYNATGFILNMTKGITTDFGVSLTGVPIMLNEEIEGNSILEEAKQTTTNIFTA